MGVYDDELKQMLMGRERGPHVIPFQCNSGEPNFPAEDTIAERFIPLLITNDPRDLPPGLELYSTASNTLVHTWKKSFAGFDWQMHSDRMAHYSGGILTKTMLANNPLEGVSVPLVVNADGSITATALLAAVAGHQHIIYEAQLFMENEGAYQGGFAELVSGTTGTVHGYVGAGERSVMLANVDVEEALNLVAAAGDFAAAASTAGINLVYRTITL